MMPDPLRPTEPGSLSWNIQRVLRDTVDRRGVTLSYREEGDASEFCGVLREDDRVLFLLADALPDRPRCGAFVRCPNGALRRVQAVREDISGAFELLLTNRVQGDR